MLSSHGVDVAENRMIILTPSGTAALAVVRLSGPEVAAFAAANLSRPPRLDCCVHCQLRDGERTIDDPVAVLNHANQLDLCLHGGMAVVQATLDLAARGGFSIADAADVPEQAYDAADPLQREVLAALPAARTEAAAAILLAQPAAWAAMLARDDNAQRRAALDDLSLAHLLHPPTVAIVGIANVGKSTLANQLFGRQRAIVADHPGTTRDWVGEEADLGGLIVKLIDTPGAAGE